METGEERRGADEGGRVLSKRRHLEKNVHLGELILQLPLGLRDVSRVPLDEAYLQGGVRGPEPLLLGEETVDVAKGRRQRTNRRRSQAEAPGPAHNSEALGGPPSDRKPSRRGA